MLDFSLFLQKANYAAKLYLKIGFKIVRENEEEYIMLYYLYSEKGHLIYERSDHIYQTKITNMYQNGLITKMYQQNNVMKKSALLKERLTTMYFHTKTNCGVDVT